MTKIAVIVGSLRADSFNKKLARNLEALAPEGTEFIYTDISTLPLYSQEIEGEYPVAAQKLKDVILGADGVLVVTPEYNRSVPGVLKNAIDWASRPTTENAFDSKPTGIVGASMSPLGTALAQAHLKTILIYLNVKLMGQPEVYLTGAHMVFDDDGVVVETAREHLKKYINALVAHVNASN